MERLPIDTPDDYEPAMTSDGDASFLATLFGGTLLLAPMLTGLSVGILVGLALGELWNLVTP